MRIFSLTFKLLMWITLAFLASIVSVLFVANIQLTRMIDKDKSEIYTEKVDAICTMLGQKEERLQKTGLVDAYLNDFQRSALEALKESYYTEEEQEIYPFVLSETFASVLVPGEETNNAFQNDTFLQKQVRSSQKGELIYVHNNRKIWCSYKTFTPWGWTVFYAVPLDLKYADAREFSRTLAIIMISTSILVLVVLLFVVVRFTKPIESLTEVASKMAEGKLDQDIQVNTRDEVGKLAYSFCRMRDSIKETILKLNQEISERKAVEENLRITLDSIGDAVIATDTQGVVTQMNPVAERLTGWTFSEAKGQLLKKVFLIINGDTREKVATPVEKVLKNGEIVGLANHTLLLSKDGSEYRIADSGAPIRSLSGEICGVVLVFRDVTEERELQEQLHHSRKLDAIGQLAGGVAHDFNNMLGGILGAAELLGNYLPDNPKPKRFHSIITESVKRAGDLTDKLLSFARRQPPASTPIDVHKVLRDTVTLVKNTIDRRIKVSADFAAGSSFIVGDSSQLQNMFLNLCLNASQAMPEGGELGVNTGSEDLSAEFCRNSTFELNPGAYLKVEVRDTGFGIEKDYLPRIFEPFFTTKELGKGTGLGLAAVYGTIIQHSGAVFVESEVGVGTCFTIYLPLSSEVVKNETSLPQLQKGEGFILVVDDEKIMRITASEILNNLGYRVRSANDGKEAIEVYNPTFSLAGCVCAQKPGIFQFL